MLWLALGLGLGLGVSLYIGWVVWPLEITENNPSTLQEEYRRDYTLLIAAAYWEDGDLEAARTRLAGVDQEDPAGWLLTLTVEHILSGRDELEIWQLVHLVNDLGLYSPAIDPYLPTVEARDVSQ
jgi:hypothetical protein